MYIFFHVIEKDFFFSIERPIVRGLTKGKGTYSYYRRTKEKLNVVVSVDYGSFVGVNASKFINELVVHVKAGTLVDRVSGWGKIDQSSKESIIKFVLVI